MADSPADAAIGFRAKEAEIVDPDVHVIACH